MGNYIDHLSALLAVKEKEIRRLDNYLMMHNVASVSLANIEFDALKVLRKGKASPKVKERLQDVENVRTVLAFSNQIYLRNENLLRELDRSRAELIRMSEESKGLNSEIQKLKKQLEF